MIQNERILMQKNILAERIFWIRRLLFLARCVPLSSSSQFTDPVNANKANTFVEKNIILLIEQRNLQREA